ncbi:MAG: ABC transporter ATP-binding protein, partial [Blautia sp.]|nr:ABC transporter ATP-binding protein [Blautia sp.]
MKGKSKLSVLLRMVKLVRPLSGYMTLAVLMGSAGFLCAQFIPILGGVMVCHALHGEAEVISRLSILIIFIGLLRAGLKFGEQRTNHFIAFTLLALIRDRVFQALRRLCPAKLEGRDKGDLISLITSDVELLEVFYAHTISPICIAFLVEL